MKRQLSPLFTWRSAICRSELPSTSKHVALTLSLHMSELGDSCFPSVSRLSEETSLGRRTVQRHLANLVEEGWIEHTGWKTWETPGGDQKTKRYEARLPRGCQSDTPPAKGVSENAKGVSESAPRGRHSDTQGRYEDAKGRTGSRPREKRQSGPGDVSVTEKWCEKHDEKLRKDARGLYCPGCGDYVARVA